MHGTEVVPLRSAPGTDHSVSTNQHTKVKGIAGMIHHTDISCKGRERNMQANVFISPNNVFHFPI